MVVGRGLEDAQMAACTCTQAHKNEHALHARVLITQLTHHSHQVHHCSLVSLTAGLAGYDSYDLNSRVLSVVSVVVSHHLSSTVINVIRLD